MKKGKIISVIAVCLVLFYACENNEQVITSQDVAVKNQISVFPGNDKNSFDFVGVKHNYLLEVCQKEVSSFYCRNGKISLAESNDIAQAILFSEGYDTTYFKHKQLVKLISDSANMYRDYVSSLRLSEYGKSMIIATITEIEELANKQNDDYRVYKSIIMEKEDAIIQNTTLSENEEAILLSAMSVFRHSLYCWLQTDNYLSVIQSKAKKLPKWLRATALAVADAAGAVGGAIAGAVVGNVAGGIAGGVTGAVAASNGASTLCDNIDKIQGDNGKK